MLIDLQESSKLAKELRDTLHSHVRDTRSGCLQ